LSSTGQGHSFHVSPFGPAQGQNTLSGKSIKAQRVNAFLVNNNKGLVSSIADFLLEFNNFLNAIFNKLSFSSD
jgi:hypothetical protein